MKKASPTAEELLSRHFSARAETYHQSSVRDDDEHAVALENISTFIDELSLMSVLDVGCGTGRGIRFFLNRFPNLKAHGIEPSPAMIQAAVTGGVPEHLIVQGRAENIPYGDDSFDAVCAFAILHHIPNSSEAVSELTRVARRAVFISDSNRFGQGPLLARLLKLGFWQIGLWPFLNFIWTRGKGYTISEGDGVAYSYSVFDNYGQLARWADRLVVIPTLQASRMRNSSASPLLTASHVLLCAIKEGP